METVAEFYARERAEREALPNLTIKEYFDEWEGFDYYTEMSDDYSVTRKGNMEKSRLRELAGKSEVLIEIYNKFIAYDNPFKSTEKPKLEDYTSKEIK